MFVIVGLLEVVEDKHSDSFQKGYYQCGYSLTFCRRRSGYLETEQAVRIMAAEQLVQDIEDFRMPLWNKKSLTY